MARVAIPLTKHCVGGVDVVQNAVHTIALVEPACAHMHSHVKHNKGGGLDILGVMEIMHFRGR